MIIINLFELLLDWTMLSFEVSILTIRYPHQGLFENKSLFALAWNKESGWLFEFAFILLIGDKMPPEGFDG